MITVRRFDSFASAAPLRAAADELHRGCARPDPFSTFGFLENFHRHDELHPGGRGLQLHLLAAFRGDTLIGYAALRRELRHVLGIPVPVIGFLVTRDADRPHVVARPRDLQAVSAALYEHLLAHRDEWSLLEFRQQDAASSLWPPPAGVDLVRCHVGDWASPENGTVRVRWATLSDYVQALSKKFRSNLTRGLESLLGAGRLELLASSDPQATPALFELYLGIERRSWKARAQADIARNPLRVDYFRSLLVADQPMRISIQMLLLDGLPIAGLINGAFGDGLYALHIVYDEGLARLAPGSAILLLGMREAIRQRCAFFNLMSGFGYYKTRWLADITETRVAQIYRRGSLLHWQRRFGDWKRRRLSAASQAPTLRFNPARRAAGAGRPSAARATPAPEFERIGALVAAVRAGPGECLSAPELAAVFTLRPVRRPAPAQAAATA